MDLLRGLYVVTDARLVPGRSHLDIVKASIDGGARLVQLRDKHMQDAEFVDLALAAADLARGSGTAVIVNDRLSVAMAARTGVHLGQNDLPLKTARETLGTEALVGVSVSSLNEAADAVAGGANYIAVSPVFPPSPAKTDAGPALGLGLLRLVKASTGIPIVGIGGIHLDNAQQVLAAGADCLAVVSEVVQAPDMTASVRTMSRLISDFFGEERR